MKILQNARLEEERSCPYFKDRQSRFESLYAVHVSALELDRFLEAGWRKFGAYFFRPRCFNCTECTPIRVHVPSFKPTKSQRRVMRKNRVVDIRLDRLRYIPEVYDLYLKHSKRFDNKETSTLKDFQYAFLTPSAPGLQNLFYFEDRLIAAGFLDLSAQALSSVYFVFDPQFEKWSLGTFGILSEIQMAGFLNKPYYYLGYWIKNHRSMNYKNRFHPHEFFNWETNIWEKQEGILSEKEFDSHENP